MMENEDQIRNIISKGWAGMLVLLFAMFITDYTTYGILGNFSPFPINPGTLGLLFLGFLVCFNILIQISVKTFDFLVFRWFVVGVTGLYTVFFIYHQIFQFRLGAGIDLPFFFDIAHHSFGMLTSVVAFKWATFSGYTTFSL